MKKTVYTFCCLLILSLSLLANGDLKKAEKAYDSKKYAEALLEYEKLILAGNTSFELHYNLGNCFYKNNELGKAIYQYELAKKINPTDEDLNINLEIAKSKTIDKIDTKENFFITGLKSSVLNLFTTNKWATLTIIFIWLSVILFFIFFYKNNLIIKRFSFVIGSIFLVLFLTSYLLGYLALNSKQENKYGIIITKKIKIVNEPNYSSSIKFMLNEGTKIKIIENNKEWLLIKIDNGNEGWVKLKDIGLI